MEKSYKSYVVYNSPTGLVVYEDIDSDGKFTYTITGNVSREYTIREMGSAYDFQDLLKSKVQHVGIKFDSEYSGFYAYTKSKDLAVNFVKNCEKYFQHVKSLLY